MSLNIDDSLEVNLSSIYAENRKNSIGDSIVIQEVNLSITYAEDRKDSIHFRLSEKRGSNIISIVQHIFK